MNSFLKTWILLSFLLLGGCGSLPQFSSDLSARKIKVDGDNKEWNDAASYVDKNNMIAVSVCRDTEYVYVCMIALDPSVKRRIMRNGLVIWFDRAGSDSKIFGIKIPPGGPISPPDQMNPGEMTGDRNSGQSTIGQRPAEMEIIGPEETDRTLLPILNSEGIQSRIGKSDEGETVCELQVPLRKTAVHPNAIEPKGDFIGIGFEIGEGWKPFDKSKEERRSFPSNSEGGSRGPRGGSHRDGGRMHDTGPLKSGSMSEPLSMWWKVRL